MHVSLFKQCCYVCQRGNRFLFLFETEHKKINPVHFPDSNKENCVMISFDFAVKNRKNRTVFKVFLNSISNTVHTNCNINSYKVL